ncbi:cytidine deaminase [Candidatus Peregrinibacteria bacterium]|jgi:dCMP deaminase|nr:cytidine deaminase [Candidatus Peregrinibacteria bacterium]
MIDSRPSWDETHMDVAKVYARRSKVPFQVGAAIIKNNRTISTGYNGWDPKLGKDKREGSYELDEIHSETNAIEYLAKEGGKALEGATIYVTVRPCMYCAKSIANVGIVRVVCYNKQARNQDACPDGVQYLMDCNIKVDIIEE